MKSRSLILALATFGLAHGALAANNTAYEGKVRGLSQTFLETSDDSMENRVLDGVDCKFQIRKTRFGIYFSILKTGVGGARSSASFAVAKSAKVSDKLVLSQNAETRGAEVLEGSEVYTTADERGANYLQEKISLQYQSLSKEPAAVKSVTIENNSAALTDDDGELTGFDESKTASLSCEIKE